MKKIILLVLFQWLAISLIGQICITNSRIVSSPFEQENVFLSQPNFGVTLWPKIVTFYDDSYCRSFFRHNNKGYKNAGYGDDFNRLLQFNPLKNSLKSKNNSVPDGYCDSIPSFGPSAIVESFENIPISSNNPVLAGYSGYGFSVPVTPFTFPTGVILTDPIPNNFYGAILSDWAKGPAPWGPCISTTSATSVPEGASSINLNTENLVDVMGFSLPILASKVGLYVEGGPFCSGKNLITLKLYDTSNALIATCTSIATGSPDNWKKHFMGYTSSVSNIKKVTITGPYIVVDKLTFEKDVTFIPPKIICPSNIDSPTLLHQCSTIVNFSVSATGLPSPVISYSIAPGSIFNSGVTTVIAYASNVAGVDSCSFFVRVSDNEIPLIVTNGDKIVSPDSGQCGATVAVSATALDNCSVSSPTGVRSDGQPLNTIYPVGTTTITWNVTDVNNNPALPVSQTVVVTDNGIPYPTISATGPVTFCTGDSVTLKANPSDSGNTWKQNINFGGTGRHGAVGFSIGNKGYLGTGLDGVFKNDFWEFDPISHAWTQMADFGGTGRYQSVGFSIGDKGYIGTGLDSSGERNDFWEYTPTTNVWFQKANFGGTPREGAVGFSIGSNGFIGTGYGGNITKKDFWKYDPTNDNWVQKKNIDGIRKNALGFSIGNKGYIGLGYDGSTLKNDFFEYDASNDLWNQKSNFGGGAREGSIGFSIGNKGYIGLGYDGSVLKSDFFEYEPAIDIWIQKTIFRGTARWKATSFSIGNKGYIGTGEDGTMRSDFWEYNPTMLYIWSTGSKTSSITTNTGGNYTVTVTNTATNCSSTSAPVKVTVNDLTSSDTIANVCNKFTWHDSTYKASTDAVWHTTNAAGCDSTITLNLAILSVTSTYVKTDVSCFGNNNGSITIKPTYGVSPFSYRIGTVRAYGNANTFTNLKPGKYRVSILDANGCAGISDQVTIVQSSAIGLSIGKTNVTCYLKADGTITANGTGGTQPYQYRFGTAGTFSTTNSWTGLAPRIYSVFVKDANSCSASGNATIAQPNTPVSATFTKIDESCPNAKNGSITVNATGGTSPYKYRFGTTGNFGTVNTFNNLKAANYRVFVNDAENCKGYSIGVAIAQTSPTCTIVTKTAIASKSAEATMPVGLYVQLSPNPSRSKFSLLVHSSKQDAVTIRVLDVNGKTVYTAKGMPEQTFHFGDALVCGVYLIEVRQGDDVKAVKAIKN